MSGAFNQQKLFLGQRAQWNVFVPDVSHSEKEKISRYPYFSLHSRSCRTTVRCYAEGSFRAGFLLGNAKPSFVEPLENGWTLLPSSRPTKPCPTCDTTEQIGKCNITHPTPRIACLSILSLHPVSVGRDKDHPALNIKVIVISMTQRRLIVNILLTQ